MPTLKSLDPEFRPLAEEFVARVTRGIWQSRGARLVVTSARRTFLDQTRLYVRFVRDVALGRKTLPVAPPGSSMHELGLAFDLALPGIDPFDPESILWDAGQLWVEYGGRWVESDPVHFEVPKDW